MLKAYFIRMNDYCNILSNLYNEMYACLVHVQTISLLETEIILPILLESCLMPSGTYYAQNKLVIPIIDCNLQVVISLFKGIWYYTTLMPIHKVKSF